jgi:hypothetical protein
MSISQKVKDSCLSQFANEYPKHNKVVIVERSDRAIRIFNKNADSILFDRKGNKLLEINTRPLKNDVNALSVTFELLE